MESILLFKQKCNNEIKETFAFKSRKYPPPCSDLILFEKELSEMITSLKFRHIEDSFQRELNENIRSIKSSPNVFIFAHKTSNIYEISKHHHKNLLHDNDTKTHQEAPPKLEISINMEAKSISTKLEISDRVERITRTPVFVQIKDYKNNFRSNPTCPLINPSKNELGKLSKQLMEKINSDIIEKLQLHQPCNTNTVLKWFNITSSTNVTAVLFSLT